jgi:fatty-acyl-CoA synthase
MLSTMMQYPLTLTVARRARALAGALTRAGLNRGDRVATLMWNHQWNLESYLGVPASGCVNHTLNLRLHPEELAYIVNHAGDRILLVDDVLLPLYEKFRDKVRMERVIVVPTNGQPVPASHENYEDFLGTAAPDFQFPALDESEAAAMCYTSGTTGVPKGVLYSHRSSVLHAFGLALPDCGALGHRDTLLPVVPMFHANAWGFPYAAAMTGAKQVMPGAHLDPPSVLDLLAAEKVTRTGAVPTVWVGILDLLDKEPGRWKLQPNLLALCGGSAVPESLIRGLDRHGIELRQAWGMTELSPLGSVSTLRADMADADESRRFAVRARQGTPVPFVDLRVMVGSREAPWDGETLGELQARGPWVAASYYNLPEQAGRWTDDGWFCTGDVVTIDAEGYVRIADRTKDLIKSGGEWISSVDLENALMGHRAVREAAVIAVPHPKWVERPLAAVVVRDGFAPTEEELREHLAARFSRWQLPDAIVFVDEIPRTSVGKFQKSKLRERFAEWRWEQAAG